MFFSLHLILRSIFLILGLLAFVIQAHERRPPTDCPQAIVVTASQCNVRTINYITHSLPPSCLTSAWPNPASALTESPAAIDQQVAGSDASTADGMGGEVSLATTTTTTTASPSTAASDEINGDAAATPFMSFEDWKEMMLRKVGQDPQALRQRKPSEHHVSGRTPAEFGDSSLGEEGEISLTFDAYHDTYDSGGEGGRGGGTGSGSSNSDRSHVVTDNEGGTDDAGDETDPASVLDDSIAHRSKDAGKTCKERFSYSSFDAGATILKTGQATKNAKAILIENKDSYMLLECATQNKFVIVELSDDILIDTVVIANFEFFSSMVRHFRVSVSDRYPIKLEKWRDLGTFEARNSRDIQPFLVQNPQIWAKYVKLEFLTHYGNEYYCPVSLLRIHGSRMLDSWKDSETGHDEALRDEAFAPTPLLHNEPTAAAMEEEEEPSSSSSPYKLDGAVATLSELVSFSSQPWSDRFARDMFHQWNATCAAVPLSSLSAQQTTNEADAPLPEDINVARLSSTPSPDNRHDGGVPDQPNPTEDRGASTVSVSPKRDPSLSKQAASVPVGSSETAGTASGAPLANSSAVTTKATGSAAIGGKRNGWTTSATSASPTVQEGFFNAITKRLQQVESNLTLSLKYVEDQSRHIQDVLHKGEHRQSSKLTGFLAQMNQTVLAELRKVHDQYDQIWQSTVLALENQRDQSERDIVALSTRLNLLADEVVFQKRMAILQAVLLLSCLFLVIFSRGVPISYLAPLQESNGPSYYPTSSLSATETNHLYSTDAAAVVETKPSVADERYFAIDPSSSKKSHLTISLSDNHDTSHEDSLSSPPMTPVSSDNVIYNNTFPPSRDLQTGSLRCSASTHPNNSRKPLPSLPENSVSIDDS